MNKTFPFVATFVATLSIFSAVSFQSSAQSASNLPSVKLSASNSTSHDHSKSHHQQSNVMISNLIVREMLPGAKTTAGYFTLMNHSDKAIELTGVSSKAFTKVEIHEHVMEDGMMSMQQVSKNIVIEPHQSVKFSPGGYHLMLFTPKQKIRKGTQVALDFTFSGASSMTKDAKVISVLDQQKQANSDHSHHH